MVGAGGMGMGMDGVGDVGMGVIRSGYGHGGRRRKRDMCRPW